VAAVPVVAARAGVEDGDRAAGVAELRGADQAADRVVSAAGDRGVVVEVAAVAAGLLVAVVAEPRAAALAAGPAAGDPAAGVAARAEVWVPRVPLTLP